MKKIFIILFFLSIFAIPSNIYADTDHSESIDSILLEIRTSQNINELKEIDCDLVTDTQFENLGDAWMGVMHPDLAVHERMDSMMGGEGSETLRSAHIAIGQRYLGCGSSDWSGIGGVMGMPMMGMMNMMGGITGLNQGGGGFDMMTPFGFGGTGFLFSWIFMLFFWVLLIFGIVALIKWFFAQGKKGDQDSVQSPIETLKTRYAKGEINKKEFEVMKKELER